MSKSKRVFDVDENLEICEELISIHAINPFLQHNSSPRGLMSSSHISQILTLNNGDEKIIQSGLEKQFGGNTWSRKLENDSRIVSVIRRYDGIDATSVTETTEVTIMFEDLKTGMIDYETLPYYYSLHQYFGFKYDWKTDVLNSITHNTILPKDTILADSPAVTENSGYKYGVNANCALMTIPEVAEDGVVISESMSKKLSYDLFETRVVEYGTDTFPLNIYGDENEYKPFPEIGEVINDDSVVMVLRDYDSDLSPALTSVKDAMDFNPVFDKAMYTKGLGGVVVDIKAYHNPKFKKEVYAGTSNTVDKYVKGLIKYYKTIIDTYETMQKDHYRRFKNWDLPVSEKMSRLLIDAYAIVNPDDRKIKKTFKKDEMDIYRIEFTIKYTVEPKIGAKLTDSNGGKGVIIDVWPDDMMPMDAYGQRAQVIMDPTSTASRMNIARLYEQYLNGVSRQAKHNIIKMVNEIDGTQRASEAVKYITDEQLSILFDHVIGLVKIFETEQYDAYNAVTDIETKREIISEVIEKELFIYYKISSKKKAYEIVNDIKGTPYETPMFNVLFNSEGQPKQTIDKMIIAPMYLILLSKTADSYLSTSSAKTNHYGLPIGVSKADKNRIPWRNSPTKILSETESRLYAGYVGRKGIAELKDRASSIETHEHIYKGILSADQPTNINNCVDRTQIQFGGDSALTLVESIFNCAGIDMVYVPEDAS